MTDQVDNKPEVSSVPVEKSFSGHSETLAGGIDKMREDELRREQLKEELDKAKGLGKLVVKLKMFQSGLVFNDPED